MLQQLINLREDIKKLYDEGYSLEVNGNFLVVHHIPYVNSNKEVKYGSLVCLIARSGATNIAGPQDHTIHFAGELPCDESGKALNAIINSSGKNQLTETISVDHYFSSRPIEGNYKD